MKHEIKTKKYAVVDLEATSASADAQIIQVGIVIVQNGHILETYETDVNPHEPLTPHIKQLTGITDAQLAMAPDFGQVARDIYDLIEDAVFVAHNVKFDANLLAEALFFEGFELRTPRVDTVELSQVFFPTLDRYNLSYITEELEIELTDAHTAIADAMATAHLFLKIQQKIMCLPQVTLTKIMQYADHFIYESSLVITELLPYAQQNISKEYNQVLDLILKKQLVYGEAYHLAPDFEHNVALLDLDARPQQADFARLVTQHLDDQKINFIQGQAGIGKTYGYLLPILAKYPKRKLVISTPTKLLQDQIMETEGRRLGEVFHINCHSLKGFDNYIKLDNFWTTLEREDDNRLVNRYKMLVLVWLTETKTGDLAEIKQKQGFMPYFDELRHDGKISELSLFRDDDFWQQSYERSKVSQVIVTNHSYLLTRVVDDKAFVEDAILVIDEAQKMPSQLENFSRRQVRLASLISEVEVLYRQSPDLLTRRLLESISYHMEQLADSAGKPGKEAVVESCVSQMRQDLGELGPTVLPRLAEVLAPQFDDFWVTQEVGDDKRIRVLHAASLDYLYFKDLLPDSTKLFCISATLEISKRVNLAQLLGFSTEQVTMGHMPQDRQANQKVWLLKDVPQIQDLSLEAYADLIAHQIKRLERLRQPMLVLFNANQSLLAVSRLLSDFGINHLAQHGHGTAANIKKRFERGEAQIILGSGAFWEGVDFVNHDQMLVLITRLPFENPQDRFVQKINRYLRLTGRKPFEDYHLPQTILKLKQAIGRSSRRPLQSSAIIILDNRVLNRKYGKSFRDMLESVCEVEDISSQKLVQAIRKHLK
ncbi:bifunctional DnaQ family exonuclease/ATP-dependent helicase [Streptococcus moroccensis]|uniref:3'-5' exonuclease DinG n=1 Tax=Streptococcus moroccensis TaxID=1451356 RepID=A0ABT9YQX5_9STRE|nr:bifunctional DnaQ family exonuclease/ATP-dependent helicase [Streptococcus moroccensis]MDQ0221703.1 ATP-dependent DNA helicase DinG [Streptococcus moroccensis]